MKITTSTLSKQQAQDYRNRFSGVERLYGRKMFKALPFAHITIIGIGGVGSWSAEALARTGVGEITLIDLDDICITNTNRQLHTLVDNIGKLKIEVMAQRLMAINPYIKVNTIADFITKDNLSALIPRTSHVVIDAVDSLYNKIDLALYCQKEGTSLVIVGAAGGKQDPTQIRSGDLCESTQDYLLKQLRKKLRRWHDFPRVGPMNISCVYSLERARYQARNGEVCFKDELQDKSQAKLDCAQGMGTVSFATAGFGFAASCEVIKLIEKMIN